VIPGVDGDRSRVFLTVREEQMDYDVWAGLWNDTIETASEGPSGTATIPSDLSAGSWPTSFSIGGVPDLMPNIVEEFIRRGLIQFGRSAGMIRPPQVPPKFHSPLATWAIL
jgi:hypothetical protein